MADSEYKAAFWRHDRVAMDAALNKKFKAQEELQRVNRSLSTSQTGNYTLF